MSGPWEQYQAAPASDSPSSGDPLDQALSAEGISGDKANFIRSIYQQESGSGKNTKTSNAGAVGGMQIIPSTFKSVADPDWDIKDPVQNARAGARYAAQMFDKAEGDPAIAGAGYYGGPGALEKAKQGIAVGDPRNSKAPNTLQYGEQVASRMPKDSGGAKPWEQYGKSEDVKPQDKPVDDKEKETKSESMLASTGKNILAGADTLAILPGAVLGPVASATGRWVAIAQGAQGEDISKFGHEFGQTVAEKLSNPIHKILDSVGFDYGYSETGVGKAMNKVSEVVNKGAEWLSKKSGMPLEDAQDLTNAGAMLVAPSATRLTAKAMMASGTVADLFKKAPVEEATLREVDPAAPKPPAQNSTPQDLAKQHIEETTGVKSSKERTPAYEDQRRSDARAAFADDQKYTDYLKNFANQEATAKDSPVQIKADQLEVEKKLEDAQKPSEPEKPITLQEALPALKKPGFQRTPEDILKIRAYNRQAGGADPEVLAKMAAVGLGVTAGVWLDPDHPVEGALLGAIGGFVTAKLGLKAGDSAKTVKEFFSPDKRIRITDMANEWESSQAKAGRAICQEQDAILQDAKSVDSRNKITNWIQGDKTIKLTDKEYAAAQRARTFFNKMGEEGIKTGVLTNLLPDYVTNLWDLEGSNKSAWGKIASNMSQESRFNLQRKIASIAEGKKLGLKPVTEDVATIMGIYGNSLTRTMANKQLMTSLENTAVGDNALVMGVSKAPKGYVPIDHPQMRGKLVHPDIKKSMEFVFQQRSPTGIRAGIEGLNTAIKRMDVSFSLFHAKALGDAFVGAGGNPIKIIGMAAGTNKYLQMIKRGGAGDLVDKAHEGGLMFTLPKGELADEDIGGSFYKSMNMIQKSVDEVIPGAGKVIKGFETANHAVDELVWARLHAGMKLETFATSYEKLKKNNVLAHEKDPKVPLKTDKEISGIAASFSNDLFGGLNWRRAAEETKTAFGRDIALTLASPEGRRNMQLLMFAPDWTVSTTRAAIKAFGKGTGFKGLVRPQELADLHRQYILRSAMYYFTVGNALNYALSGHSILQNKDPTQIELGDGRTLQFSKHMMEPVHWITKPGQQAMNKLGILPAEAIEQIVSKEYLSTQSSPDMEAGIAGHARHALKKLVPISMQARDPESAVAGVFGFPIGGRTKEQKVEDKQKSKERRKKEKTKNTVSTNARSIRD